MIYLLPLQVTGLAAGLLLVVAHAIALARPEPVSAWLQTFPRSRGPAAVLLVVAAVWSFVLVRSIDLGEFTPLRMPMLVAIVVGAILAWIYVPEFLAVRALGMVLLLAAEPLLESAVLRDEISRLILVLLAYAWAIGGLFLVGMPYLLRDAIHWVTKTPGRFRIAAGAGLAYGIILLICAAVMW
ncbi:MAG: hypothetical protein SFU53_08000 [Terrimicrobiaceae bacterium]|nr:hypothetical protein [Terrimicrobiaceae bacterium]